MGKVIEMIKKEPGKDFLSGFTPINLADFPNPSFRSIYYAQKRETKERSFNKKSKKNKRKKQGKKIKVAGEISDLFCGDRKCQGLVILDQKTGLYQCFTCKKYWRYKGKARRYKIERKKEEKKKLI